MEGAVERNPEYAPTIAFQRWLALHPEFETHEPQTGMVWYPTSRPEVRYFIYDVTSDLPREWPQYVWSKLEIGEYNLDDHHLRSMKYESFVFRTSIGEIMVVDRRIEVTPRLLEEIYTSIP